MSKRFSTIICIGLVAAIVFANNGYAKANTGAISNNKSASLADSAATRAEVIGIINKVIKSSASFDISAVADLYAPNAVVADEEPPFSWNGPTAGVQWVSTVEKTCKDLKLKEFKGKIGRITIYLQTDESIYVVVPVDYSGEVKGESFDEDGAFAFVFRKVSDKWLIKSQVWVTKKGM